MIDEITYDTLSLFLPNLCFIRTFCKFFDYWCTIIWFPSLLACLLLLKYVHFSMPSSLGLYSSFYLFIPYFVLPCWIPGTFPSTCCQALSTVHDSSLCPVSCFPFSVSITKVKKQENASSFCVIISSFS